MNRSIWKSALRQMLATCCVSSATAVLAQGVYPGDLSTDGYKLPGGFQPVLQLRTFYFDAESLTGARSEAWAIGGWAGARSPWWGNLFQVGLVGYTSQKLYGPSDEDGTKLLEPGQHSFAVIGEAFAALKVFDQTLAGYRQLVNRPFINPIDNRMVPNTFEGYTLTGSADNISYTGGYLTKVKLRDSDSFQWMSNAAGGTGPHRGVYYAGGTWDFVKNGNVRLDDQYGEDVFNTFYVDGKYPIAIDDKTRLTLGAQYIRQKSVGAAQIGDFSTNAVGVQAAIAHGPFDAFAAYTETSRGFDTQNPYGDHPSYLYLMQVAFNGAGEKAWGVGGNVRFATLGVPGLSAGGVFAQGYDRINAGTGAPIGNRNELDVRVDYAFVKGTALEGLVATARYSLLHQDGSAQNAPQLRLYLNYAVRF
jgi:hypothetical protein